MLTLTMTFFQVDISNKTQMSSLKDRLQSLPDVAGIVHTAMVLRDEFLKDLTSQSFNEVMGPKIKGKTSNQIGLSLTFHRIFNNFAKRLFAFRPKFQEI